MRRAHLAATALATVALLGACSDEQEESVESALEEATEDAEQAIDEAATDAEQVVDEAAADAAELAVRNLAAEQGEEQFADAGHPLDGDLECTATAGDGLERVSVDCTGTTEDGGAAALTGETGELADASVTELQGQFTGTVDGTEVFTTDRLGG